MDTKSLLYGIGGFVLGGLVMALAVTVFNKPAKETAMTMDGMVSSLQTKTGDAYDKAFIDEMVEHHQGAVAMARLSQTRAHHQEIKDLSAEIISAQQKEISQMNGWRTSWQYPAQSQSMDMQYAARNAITRRCLTLNCSKGVYLRAPYRMI